MAKAAETTQFQSHQFTGEERRIVCAVASESRNHCRLAAGSAGCVAYTSSP